jgi:hypothetical protein
MLWGFSLNHDFPTLRCFHNEEAKIYTVQSNAAVCANLTFVTCKATKKSEQCSYRGMSFPISLSLVF